MGKDKRVVSMDAEAIAVIKKNKKIQHERMRQGNARIIVIHPFVFGMIIFLSLLVESNGWKDRKSTRLNSSHANESRMPSSA